MKWRKEILFNKWCSNKGDPHAKTNLDLHLTTFITVNLKWITELNVKCETIKFLEHNIGENLGYLGFSRFFLDTPSQAPFAKELTDKLDFIKMKNFCSMR